MKTHLQLQRPRTGDCRDLENSLYDNTEMLEINMRYYGWMGHCKLLQLTIDVIWAGLENPCGIGWDGQAISFKQCSAQKEFETKNKTQS